MTIRQKTLANIAFTFFSLVTVLFLFSSLQAIREGENLDRSNLLKDLVRVRLALEEEARELNRTAADWAFWDDTYDFLRDFGADYIADNLEPSSLSALRVHDFLLFDPSGHLLLSRSVDPEEVRPLPLLPGLDALGGPGQPFHLSRVPREGIKGLLQVSGGTILAAARPILNSQGQGTLRGVLVLVRRLDSLALQHLRERTQVHFDLLPLGPHIAPPAARFESQGEDAHRGFVPLEDLTGNPSLWISATQHKAHVLLAKRNLTHMALVFLVASLFLGTVAAWGMERILIHRLQRFQEELRVIGDTENPAGRVTEEGDDELGDLARRINRTLASLEESQLAKRLTDRALRSAHQELSEAYDKTLEGWSFAMDLRDKETEGHTLRVTERTLALARHLGFPEEEQAHMRRGALLHDIGKLGIPDRILLKEGPLTKEEWAIMRQHPVLAYEMLSPIRYLHPALSIPYCHHERWDGTGYPQGLSGEQIPRSARLFAVVDIWDALSSDRPYRAAWPQERVYEHLRSLRGTHLDPQGVDAFFETFPLEAESRPS